MAQKNIQNEVSIKPHHTSTISKSGYCPLEAGEILSKDGPTGKIKPRISSFDPDINWDSIKGSDEEN